MRRDASGRDLLLGDHRHARRGPGERFQDDRLRSPVRLGHRRSIALGLHLEPATADGKDRLTSFPSRFRQRRY